MSDLDKIQADFASLHNVLEDDPSDQTYCEIQLQQVAHRAIILAVEQREEIKRLRRTLEFVASGAASISLMQSNARAALAETDGDT